jgi:hypothetical protein
MVGELRVRITQSSQVNQPFYPTGSGRFGKALGSVEIPGMEVTSGHHAVNQVVGDIYTGKCGRQGLGQENIALKDLDLVKPSATLQTCRIAGENSDPVSSL